MQDQKTVKNYFLAFRAKYPLMGAQKALNEARAIMLNPDSVQCKPNPYHTKRDFTLWGGGPIDKIRWCENAEKAGLRFVCFADDVLTYLNHKGYFTDDDFCGEVLRGAVWQLPARNGVARFVGGYFDPCNDGAALIDTDICEENARVYTYWDKPQDYDAARDAARMADCMAEHDAEEQREYNHYWQLSRDIEEKREEIKKARAEHSKLVQELSTLERDSAIFEYVMRELRTLQETVHVLTHDIRETLRELPNGEIVE